jgi:hypothetical protein
VQLKTVAFDLAPDSSASSSNYGPPVDHPDCIAAEEAHDRAADAMHAALDDLLKTAPATMAGAAALLDYLTCGRTTTTAHVPTTRQMRRPPGSVE